MTNQTCLIVLTAIVYNCNNVNSDNDHYINDENIKGCNYQIIMFDVHIL